MRSSIIPKKAYFEKLLYYEAHVVRRLKSVKKKSISLKSDKLDNDPRKRGRICISNLYDFSYFVQ